MKTLTLRDVLDLVVSAEVNADDAAAIDVRLAEVQVDDVPSDQARTLIEYIDFRMRFKAVPASIQSDLQRLYDGLEKQFFNASK